MINGVYVTRSKVSIPRIIPLLGILCTGALCYGVGYFLSNLMKKMPIHVFSP